MKECVTELDLGTYRAKNQEGYNKLIDMLGYINIPFERLCDILTVGKMIELLEQDKEILIPTLEMYIGAIGIGYNNDAEWCLCDVLFEQLKELIKKSGYCKDCELGFTFSSKIENPKCPKCGKVIPKKVNK